MERRVVALEILTSLHSKAQHSFGHPERNMTIRDNMHYISVNIVLSV